MEQSETILLKLKSALDSDGDFPTRARIIAELQKLTEDIRTPINKVVETVLREPSLATRILHLVNSVMYARASQITTLSQAVLHLGLKSIYDLCANFVLMQRFTPLAKKGSAFFDCFMLSLLTANIASLLDKREKNATSDEEGYLSGSLFTLGPLLLGYYFPKLFEDAEKRADRRKISLFKSVEELLGVPAVGVSLGVVDSLSVPESYKETLTEAFILYSDPDAQKLRNARTCSAKVALATLLSECIIESSDVESLRTKLTEICSSYGYEYEEVFADLKKLPFMIKGQADLLEIASDSLPEAFLDLLDGKVVSANDELAMEDSVIAPYIEQLEQAVRESETLPSMVATVMEAMLFALDFERVVYLESDLSGTSLVAKLGLGDELGPYDTLSVNIEAKSGKGVVEKAFFNGSVESTGLALLEDAWPCLAIPVGYDNRSIGIIYADKLDKGDIDTLADGVTFSCSIFADILDKAIQKRRD